MAENNSRSDKDLKQSIFFFGETLRAICEKTTPESLAAIFNSLFPDLKDKDSSASDIPFKAIDPFTFIAAMNSGSDDDRLHICESTQRRLEINASVPSSFALMPFFNPFKCRFIPYSYNGADDAICKIWDFSKELISGKEITPESFNTVCQLQYAGIIKLSQILYLCFPDKYYLLDRRTSRFLGFEREDNYENFKKFQEKANKEFPGITPMEFMQGVISGSMASVAVEIPSEQPAETQASTSTAEKDRSEAKDKDGKKAKTPTVSSARAAAAAALATQKDNDAPKFPLNQILFGPAGPGKTYSAIIRAMEIADERHYGNLTPERYSMLKKRFDQLRAAGRIEMVTFHSNYSYEEFVEGIKPNTENRDMLIYTKENGIFKMLVNVAKAEQLKTNGGGRIDFSMTRVFKLSLRNTANPEDGDIYEYCLGNDVIAMGYGGDIDLSCVVSRNDINEILENSNAFSEKRFTGKAIEIFKLLMREGDIVLISNGNDNVRAIAQITGDYEYNEMTPLNYCHFRPVRWLYHGGNIPVEKLLITNKLPRQPIYSFCNLKKEGINGYNENINTQYLGQLLGGLPSSRAKNYVLIIDEINRGDLSRIFGELTTLIDDDKRLGASNELTVKLPYTKELFGIPKNLYIIGTMSVADRQTHPVDFTLRRRFSFIELPPKAEFVPEEIRDVYILLNKRINALLGGDYLIGHGYFMNRNRSAEDTWFTSVIPLIGEYCRGRWDLLEQLLGPAQSETNRTGKNGKYASFIKSYTTEELSLKGEGGYCYGFAEQDECDFKAALENLMQGTRKAKSARNKKTLK